MMRKTRARLAVLTALFASLMAAQPAAMQQSWSTGFGWVYGSMGYAWAFRAR